jgi:7-carboxy-7-deazaguanine synthase
MTEKKYAYSEIFNSIQGEGMYTGQWTVWLRFYLCNLQCNGFGQDQPTKPETYDLPHLDFDVSTVDRVEDLPVWEKGCDSSYTWSKKFKHLMTQQTAKQMVDAIRVATITDTNLNGDFLHPNSQQTADMCFTGGEPLMKHAQNAFMEIYQGFKDEGNLPRSVTFETNGTQKLSDEFEGYLMNRGKYNTPLLFSVSPKLWTVAGELPTKAIKPDVVAQYQRVGNWVNSGINPRMPSGQLKFVVGPRDDQWDELEQVVAKFREAGVDWPVYIMPVGATVEEQEATAGEVAAIAFKRGYNVSGRLHCYLFGNAIGT